MNTIRTIFAIGMMYVGFFIIYIAGYIAPAEGPSIKDKLARLWESFLYQNAYDAGAFADFGTLCPHPGNTPEGRQWQRGYDQNHS